MSASVPRKGARRAADIAPDVLAALERGELQTATLAEGLALNQATLVRAVFPDLPRQAMAQIEAACALGILKRMDGIGRFLFERFGPAAITQCRQHVSDTVRGWACFAVGALPALSVGERLAAIRPLADDAHFGVREWAWMAVRPHLAAELDAGIAQLAAWTQAPSERLRRFASEALRPRGVWCAHITELKKSPQRAMPILEPLKADPSAYVQDSVANWLNDAAKDNADWVRALCRQWEQGDPPPATRRICKRALRSLA